MRTESLLILFRELSKAMLRGGVALVFLALSSLPASAQVYAEYNFVFSPPNPKPGENVTVFIRGTDPVNGFVFCPERGLVITGVQVTGDQIVIELLPYLIAGGIISPYCDGNSVSLGSLEGGVYTATARPVLNGTPGPVFVSGLLTVGALPVPTLSPSALFTYAGLVLLVGMLWSIARGRDL
jgi:hypothetical protein